MAPRSSHRGPARLTLIALASACVAAAAGPAGAAAEACPGSGTGPCPYTSVEVIGQRAEGVLRFPEAVAVDAGGDVYVADQLGYVVQKFSAAGELEATWGSYGGGPGQFGPIGGIAVGGAGDVYVVDSSHDRVERFGPNAHGARAGARSASSTSAPRRAPASPPAAASR